MAAVIGVEMSDDFPLSKKAGLKILLGLESYFYEPLVLAKDVEAFLSNAPVVYGHRNYSINCIDKNDLDQFLIGTANPKSEPAEFSAKLIMIEPIKQKSREEKLEDFIREIWAADILPNHFDEKAEKLLGTLSTTAECVCGEINVRSCPVHQ